MHSRKLMAEGIKKDEGNFDMENDGNQAVLCGFVLGFSQQNRLIKAGIFLLMQVKTTYHSVVTFSKRLLLKTRAQRCM